jgi:hypothetical protein
MRKQCQNEKQRHSHATHFFFSLPNSPASSALPRKPLNSAVTREPLVGAAARVCGRAASGRLVGGRAPAAGRQADKERTAGMV